MHIYESGLRSRGPANGSGPQNDLGGALRDLIPNTLSTILYQNTVLYYIRILYYTASEYSTILYQNTLLYYRGHKLPIAPLCGAVMLQLCENPISEHKIFIGL